MPIAHRTIDRILALLGLLLVGCSGGLGASAPVEPEQAREVEIDERTLCQNVGLGYTIDPLPCDRAGQAEPSGPKP